jgi:hypothetical protein
MKNSSVFALLAVWCAMGVISCTKQIEEPVLPAEEEFVFEMKIDTIGDWVLVAYYEDPETGERIGVYEPIRDTLNFD